MRFVLPALALLALVLSPSAGVAATSAEQQGSFSVPFACSTSSFTAALQDQGNGVAWAEVPNDLSHNSGTQLALSDVTITGPGGINFAPYHATLDVYGDKGKALGLLKGARGKGNQAKSSAGLQRYLGVTRLTLTTTEPAFRAGDYTVTANLSCSQEI